MNAKSGLLPTPGRGSKVHNISMARAFRLGRSYAKKSRGKGWYGESVRHSIVARRGRVK